MSRWARAGRHVGVAMAAIPLAIFAATPLVAGPLAEAAAKAEALAAAGDSIGAHDTLQAAIGTFSTSYPFAIGKALFVTQEPTGYAMFEKRATSVFPPGEKLISYIEPIGLAWKPGSEPDRMQSHFTVDFDILDPGGQVLASQKAIGEFTFTGFVRNQEIYATLTVDVGDAPSGNYILRFRFNDLNSGKSATVDQPFSVSATP